MQLAAVSRASVIRTAVLDTGRRSYTISYMKLGRQAMWSAGKGREEGGRPAAMVRFFLIKIGAAVVVRLLVAPGTAGLVNLIRPPAPISAPVPS
jgi:hypothetical protein